MLLAAYADDAGDFRDAYTEAVDAAKETGRKGDEALDYVKRSFATYHPLKSAFRTPPSERDFRAIIDVLPADGQADGRTGGR